MMKRLLTAAFLVSVVLSPAGADESVGELIKRLEQKKQADRLKAIVALRKKGDAACEALQAYLDPTASQKSPVPIAEGDLKDQIDKLITQLGAAQYKIRESATQALVKIGKAATAQLRVASKSDDLETSQRSKRVLLALYPAPTKDGENTVTAKIEAALLLAELGSSSSIPALTYALRNGSAGECAAADFALRTIRRGGPTTSVMAWYDKAKRKEQIDAWTKFLATPATKPAGEPAKLVLKYVKDTKFTCKTDSSFSMRMDLSKLMGGRGPAGTPMSITYVMKENAVSEITIHQSEPVVVTRAFTEHKQSLQTLRDGAGLGAAREQSWKGKQLKLTYDGAGKLTRSIDGAPLGSRQRYFMSGLGSLPFFDMPGGKYEPGTAKQVPRELANRIASSMTGMRFGANTKVADHAGKLVFLGRPGGQDRYYLSITISGDQSDGAFGGGGTTRYAIGGQIVVDADRGLVKSYQLGGPTWQSQVRGAAGSMEMVGEVRYKFTLEAPATEPTKTPKDDEKQPADK